jgi:hypothetical protein
MSKEVPFEHNRRVHKKKSKEIKRKGVSNRKMSQWKYPQSIH